MLELAILGLLQDQDLHGYELKKRLTETVGTLSSVSFGSLYPALARLEKAGAVHVLVDSGSEPTAAPIPMTGSLGGELAAFRARLGGGARRSSTTPFGHGGGKARKVYGITTTGRSLFEELLLGRSADDDRSFGLKLAFARHLPPDARLGLLERRRAQLVERLDRARTSVRTGRERLDAYARSLLEHGNETTERDISWLDRLIAAERNATQPQTASTSTTAGGTP